MRRLVGPQAPCGPVRSAAPGMSLIEVVRGLALVSWMGLAVHADVAAVPGGERHRSPVDALADGRAALPERLCRRRMAEQSVLRQRWLVDALFGGGFGGGMAHMAPGDTGQQWTRRSATHRSAAPSVRRLSPSVGGYRVRCEPAMAAVCTFGVHESSNVAVSLGAPGGGRERGRSCMGRGGVLDGCVMAFRRGGVGVPGSGSGVRWRRRC